MAKERIMRSVLDSAFDSIIVTDELGTIVDVNTMTLDVFGFVHMNDVIGLNISTFVGGGHAVKHEAYMEAFHKRGGISRLLGRQRNLVARRRDRTEFPCKIGVKKVPGSNLLVGYIRDITDEIKAYDLAVEKKAAEHLLLNMLPTEIAQRLKNEPGQIADHFTEAVVLFGDIVGFTSMSSVSGILNDRVFLRVLYGTVPFGLVLTQSLGDLQQLSPIEVVTFLNDIFSRFDANLDEYGLNKIKTIGDCKCSLRSFDMFNSA